MNKACKILVGIMILFTQVACGQAPAASAQWTAREYPPGYFDPPYRPESCFQTDRGGTVVDVELPNDCGVIGKFCAWKNELYNEKEERIDKEECVYQMLLDQGIVGYTYTW